MILRKKERLKKEPLLRLEAGSKLIEKGEERKKVVYYFR